MNDLNDDLHETLVRHAHDLDGTPLSLDTVRTRARRIRRNRRLAVAGGVAAALVVIVPTGMLAAGNLDAGRRDPLPATSSPSDGPTKAGDPDLAPSGLGIAYAEGTTLTEPDGSTVILPRRYARVVEGGGEIYGLSSDPDTGFWTADVLDGEGREVTSFPVTQSVVPNADGTAVVYATPEGDLVERAGGTDTTLATGLGPVDPVALLGGPDCGPDARGCVVWVNRQDGGAPQQVKGGVATDVPGQPLDISDVTRDGRIVMQTESTDTGACFGVFFPDASRFLLRTCDNSLFRISPDGRHLSASTAYLDGAGNSSASILDAQTGEEIARYAPEAGTIPSMVWEDATHLLLVQRDESGWSVIRLGLDSSIEAVLGPSARNGETPAYQLVGPQ